MISKHIYYNNNQDMQIIVARKSEHFHSTVQLFKEYAIGLGIDLQFQNFDQELQTLPTMYGPPTGELWLIQNDEQFVGCAGLRRLDAQTCELKRMYIQPNFRGIHLGKQLLNTALTAAHTMGYEKMKLDTLRRLAPAVRLYQSFGFVEIAPYNYNPEADIVYLERKVIS